MIAKSHASTQASTQASKLDSYPTFGHWLRDVRDVEFGDRRARIRLMNTQGSDEQATVNDAYGGFLIPELWLPTIKEVGYFDPTVNLVQNVRMATNRVNVPARVDKNHSTLLAGTVTGGINMTNRTETQDGSYTRGEVELVTLECHSVTGLVYSTEELLNDAPDAAAMLIRRGLAMQLGAYSINKKINGNGAGEPEGILNAPCKVAVTRATANNVHANDLADMLGRCWNIKESIFLAHPATMPFLLETATTTTLNNFFETWGWEFSPEGERMAYTPPALGSVPVFFTEFCQSDVGTQGDIILFQPSEYLWGLRSETFSESIAVRFAANERAFRYVCRCDGRIWWRSALTPADGSNTLSPVVTLTTNT